MQWILGFLIQCAIIPWYILLHFSRFTGACSCCLLLQAQGTLLGVCVWKYVAEKKWIWGIEQSKQERVLVPWQSLHHEILSDLLLLLHDCMSKYLPQNLHRFRLLQITIWILQWLLGRYQIMQAVFYACREHQSKQDGWWFFSRFLLSFQASFYETHLFLVEWSKRTFCIYMCLLFLRSKCKKLWDGHKKAHDYFV